MSKPDYRQHYIPPTTKSPSDQVNASGAIGPKASTDSLPSFLQSLPTPTSNAAPSSLPTSPASSTTSTAKRGPHLVGAGGVLAFNPLFPSSQAQSGGAAAGGAVGVSFSGVANLSPLSPFSTSTGNHGLGLSPLPFPASEHPLPPTSASPTQPLASPVAPAKTAWPDPPPCSAVAYPPLPAGAVDAYSSTSPISPVAPPGNGVFVLANGLPVPIPYSPMSPPPPPGSYVGASPLGGFAPFSPPLAPQPAPPGFTPGPAISSGSYGMGMNMGMGLGMHELLTPWAPVPLRRIDDFLAQPGNGATAGTGWAMSPPLATAAFPIPPLHLSQQEVYPSKQPLPPSLPPPPIQTLPPPLSATSPEPTPSPVSAGFAATSAAMGVTHVPPSEVVGGEDGEAGNENGVCAVRKCIAGVCCELSPCGCRLCRDHLGWVLRGGSDLPTPPSAYPISSWAPIPPSHSSAPKKLFKCVACGAQSTMQHPAHPSPPSPSASLSALPALPTKPGGMGFIEGVSTTGVSDAEAHAFSIKYFSSGPAPALASSSSGEVVTARERERERELTPPLSAIAVIPDAVKDDGVVGYTFPPQQVAKAASAEQLAMEYSSLPTMGLVPRPPSPPFPFVPMSNLSGLSLGQQQQHRYSHPPHLLPAFSPVQQQQYPRYPIASSSSSGGLNSAEFASSPPLASTPSLAAPGMGIGAIDPRNVNERSTFSTPLTPSTSSLSTSTSSGSAPPHPHTSTSSSSALLPGASAGLKSTAARNQRASTSTSVSVSISAPPRSPPSPSRSSSLSASASACASTPSPGSAPLPTSSTYPSSTYPLVSHPHPATQRQQQEPLLLRPGTGTVGCTRGSRGRGAPREGGGGGGGGGAGYHYSSGGRNYDSAVAAGYPGLSSTVAGASVAGAYDTAATSPGAGAGALPISVPVMQGGMGLEALVGPRGAVAVTGGGEGGGTGGGGDRGRWEMPFAPPLLRGRGGLGRGGTRWTGTVRGGFEGGEDRRQMSVSMGGMVWTPREPPSHSLPGCGSEGVAGEELGAGGGEEGGGNEDGGKEVGVRECRGRWPVVKVENIPFSTTMQDVLDWLPVGYLPSKEEVVMPIHLVLHRSTGRTLPHCYLETRSIAAANQLINLMDRSQLGDRTVRVKWERPGELMRDFFSQEVFFQQPIESYRSPAAAPLPHLPPEGYRLPSVVLTKEDLTRLVGFCQRPVQFRERPFERAFFNMISLMAKFPWYREDLWEEELRDHILDAADQVAERAKGFADVNPLYLDVLEKLVATVLDCPAFTEVQKLEIHQYAPNVESLSKPSISHPSPGGVPASFEDAPRTPPRRPYPLSRSPSRPASVAASREFPSLPTHLQTVSDECSNADQHESSIFPPSPPYYRTAVLRDVQKKKEGQEIKPGSKAWLGVELKPTSPSGRSSATSEDSTSGTRSCANLAYPNASPGATSASPLPTCSAFSPLPPPTPVKLLPRSATVTPLLTPPSSPEAGRASNRGR
ncbi:hypothetical protein JCM11641_007649 [Rhodosporidiobolus odoratus]